MARRRGFLEKTALQISVALRETLVDEELARRPGLLQSLDPRVKVVTTIVLLLVVGLTRRVEVLAGLYLLSMTLVWCSRLPLGTVVRRVSLFTAFTAVVALPALFLTPGDPWLTLIERPTSLVVTRQGLRSAGTLVLRVSTSVSLAILLVLTTPWPALLKALRSLGVPQPLVLILSMTRRYIFLLLQSAEELLLARRSRLLGRLPAGQGRRLVAGMAGMLVARAYSLSEEVHLAMEARGFRGEVRLIESFHLRARDLLWAGAVVLIGGMALWIGR